MSVQPDMLFGRKVIYIDDVKIDQNNICDILTKITDTHRTNAMQIDRLYRIYKGDQSIFQKTRTVRDDVNNIIVVNFAHFIVAFNTGYLLGKPIQYVSCGEDTMETSDKVSREIDTLNRYAKNVSKAAEDDELAKWFNICGTSYRFVMSAPEDSNSPFATYTVDPRCAFVAYSNFVDKKRKLGVIITTMDDGTKIYNCYTDKLYIKVSEPFVFPDSVLEVKEHVYGAVPLIEYPANTDRIGSFEIVLPLLDAINAAFSDLADGREQFINALLVIKGADIPDEDFKKVKEYGGIKVPSDGDVKYLVSELNQTENGETIKLMISTMLTIAGIPDRSGNEGGTSDNGIAVFLRSGYEDSEMNAERFERIFTKSENEFLKIVLRICNCMKGMQLKLESVEPHFTRQNTDNMLTKVQSLMSMLSSDKVHPLLAWRISSLVSDPESAYMISQEYENQRLAEEEKRLNADTVPAHDDQTGADLIE